ncbi:hypothetical protein GJ744_006654 [Endocarpon pusillum]|uniref:Fungal N-terminal domain-containing protein n=1 Tax=Endocarpon pusillum TaxID=364733 RepID=A0A8H7AJR5_9EURO|nr:hypothetical protein GJ744_006654 [Endocarpon pusillum]
MDPFSITVGAAALTQLATKIAVTLKDTYQAYHSAPEDMLEIADQITLVAGLVDVFAKSIDGTRRKFPKTFQEHAMNLVRQCETILKEIQRMIPGSSTRSVNVESLRYAFGNKKKIEKQQTALKGVQHMFMFMTTCYMYSLPQEAEVASAAPVGSLHGVMKHVPIQISMNQDGGNSPTVAYEATLTLRPAPHVPSRNHADEPFARGKASQHERSYAGERRESERSRLANMRRSPYFALALLEPPLHGEDDRRTERQEAPMYRRVRLEAASKSAFELPSDREATEEVDDLLSRWFDDDTHSNPNHSHDESYSVPHTDPEVDEHDSDNDRNLPSVSERPENAPQSMPIRHWVCDGCERESWEVDNENDRTLKRFMRFKCRICNDFDFCGFCYLSEGIARPRHQHARSSFARIDEVDELHPTQSAYSPH